jgi:hypothetical protein
VDASSGAYFRIWCAIYLFASAVRLKGVVSFPALNVLPQRSSFSRIDVPETYIEEVRLNEDLRNCMSFVQVGTIRDYIWGFFMGLLVGFIMLFWLWDGGTSHRQKVRCAGRWLDVI